MASRVGDVRAATLCEYLGLALDFGERVDLGAPRPLEWFGAPRPPWNSASATPCWRWYPDRRRCPSPRSLSRPTYGPELVWGVVKQLRVAAGRVRDPYGNVGQNAPYAQIAQRYAAEFGYDPAAVAKIAVDQRTNACAHPGAVFHGTPLTVDDVLGSR